MTNSKEYISVIMIADQNIEPGIHVTLSSMLSNASAPIQVHLLNNGLKSSAIELIHKTTAKYKFCAELILYDIDTDRFSDLRGLHGNVMPYFKTVLPEYVNSRRLLYLDADLIVNADVVKLCSFDLSGFAIGAVSVGDMDSAIDRPTFELINCQLDAPYFNSGVMVIDRNEWIARSISEKLIAFANENKDKLITADQTVLNAIFYKEGFARLPEIYNILVYPTSERLEKPLSEGIYHLLGSPKPWDPFGYLLHTNFDAVEYYAKKSAYRTILKATRIRPGNIRRVAQLSRSYAKIVLNRLRG